MLKEMSQNAHYLYLVPTEVIYVLCHRKDKSLVKMVSREFFLAFSVPVFITGYGIVTASL